MLTIKVLKTGIFALCALKQTHAPFRAWAAVSDLTRGEGYTIKEAAVEYYRFVGDI